MRMKITAAIILLILLTALACTAAGETEARELTADCTISLMGAKDSKKVRDHLCTSFWEKKDARDPWVTISSPEPVYGLYLCFRSMPAYEIQVDRGNGWETYQEGNPDYLHMFYEMDGATEIRIHATEESWTTLGFNEIAVFSAGKVPEWVQRWEPTPEKTDLLFVISCPDEELLYFGGAIPVYACERQRSAAVACLSYGNPSRRSELLNSLWSMGYRYYPMIQQAAKLNSRKQDDAVAFTVNAIRHCRPEVIVTLDEKGEGKNEYRKLTAELCKKAFDLSAEGDSAWQAKKLYLHLYGDDPTVLDWTQPLESQHGRDGIGAARYAYLYYKTQDDTGKDVLASSVKYPNNTFGLYRTLVGEDTEKNDFLENIPEEDLTSAGPLKDLTVDKTEGILPELNEKGYLDSGEFIYSDDATGIYIYISQTAKIIVNRRFDGALPLTWFETEIWCDTEAGEYVQNIERDPEKRHRERGDAAETARMHHVVFAVNGDYYTYRMGSSNGHPVGIEIRNGEIYFDKQYSKKTDFFPNLDTLAFYRDGRVDVHYSYELKPQEYLDNGAYNVFSFGPYLIRDGQLSEWVMDTKKSTAKNPRHVFGMIEPGHYMDIMCEGRLNRSEGVTMYQMALIAQAAGMTECCNLDGGQTAVVVFMGKQLNRIAEYDNNKTSPRPTCEILGVGISEQVGVFEVN